MLQSPHITNRKQMKKSTIIILVVVVLLAIYAFTSYNGLVTLNERADAQWAQVETQYQRRLDLVPNLVNSVKGILTQEQKVFGDIAEARARYSGAGTPNERAAAATQVEAGLGRLLAIVESYPELKSSTNVQDLMAQLEGTENRVSVERNRYNEMIRDYNTTIKRFPKNLMAGIYGFGNRDYFESASGAENAPEVNL